MKNFSLHITLRVLLLTGMIILWVYTLYFTKMYVVKFLMGVFIMGQVVELIHYIHRTNRDIASFLLSIRHDDFSTSFQGKGSLNSFGELYQSLNQITDQFKRIRAEKESNFQYLQTVVKHVNVGLMCFDDSGEILLINRALQNLLRKPHLGQLESLRHIDPQLLEAVQQLQPGERALLKLHIDNEPRQLAIQAVAFKLQDKGYRLISMQDIKGELDTNELDAWQKLIRILTHEIMNSVSPIISLTATIQDILEEDEALAKSEAAEDLQIAMAAISKRSQGLLHFTEAYRDLTRVPMPQIQPAEAQGLIEGIEVLFRSKMEEKGIAFQLHLPVNGLRLEVDPELLEQVLINLFQNAIDALEGTANPQITVTGFRNEEGKAVLQVGDNGPGIPESLQEQLFVPFFTTKEKGSGIGLNLSRQIMRRHGGSISFQSVEGEGVVFTLVV
jgi:nitrogen fixation/metabolism regulation signal transduction histidine kinase